MALAGRDLVRIQDLDDEEVRRLLQRAEAYLGPDGRPTSDTESAGRILATLFFEPSTRTRLSFEAAAHRLGAQVIGFADPGSTSQQKGETLEDTVRMAAAYSDAIVLRHPVPGSAAMAAEIADVPVINAGDGGREHPTQALLDLFTIQRERGAATDHAVVLLGDLKHGRTVHSLAILLARFGNRLRFVAPAGLEMPPEVTHACARHGPAPEATEDLATALPDADVVYVTRVQKERFQDPQAYEAVAGSYRVDGAFLDKCKDDVTIMHPLPRVDEIAPEIDARVNAAYFRQAANGVPVRMAVLAELLGP